MWPKVLASISVLCLSTLALPAAAPDDGTHKYKIARKHYLVLKVPANWQAEVTDEKAGLFTLLVKPASGDAFKGLVSVAKRSDVPMSTPEEIEALMQYSMASLLDTAVETKVKLYRFQAEAGVGYFFRLTDKRAELPPGEYRFLSHFTVIVGKLHVGATFLTNDWEAESTRLFLEMLRTAGCSAE